MGSVIDTRKMHIEEVVRLNEDVAAVIGIGGRYVLREMLGLGVIYQTAANGEILVHWSEADMDAWVPVGDVEQLDPAVRLIAIYERNGHEKRVYKSHKLRSKEGLDHSWAVELFPENILRTIRSDGSAWTFQWFPLLERAYPLHTLQEQPPRDDDAEALTVADLTFAL